MRARYRGKKVYYFYDAGGVPRKEIALGSDYVLAVKKWAELDIKPIPENLVMLKDVTDRYLREVVPKKAARTQKDNAIEMKNLLAFFNDPPAALDQIRPLHVRQYLEHRKDAKVRATREKALLSHVFNMAREWGYTDMPNPCAGIKGVKSQRTVYIEEEIYRAVYEAANQPLRDAMDLAYLTGQRPADTLSMSETDIRDGALEVDQGKTGTKVRIEIVGELKTLLDNIAARKKLMPVRALALVINEKGRPFSYSAMDNRWEHARARAVKAYPKLKEAILQFQFRDLRAKAGTDKAASDGVHQAQRQLGHSSVTTTEIYVRNRRGEKVTPTR
jgi:integrase